MTDAERAREGWESYPEPILVGEYDDGTIVFPACERCDAPGAAYATHGEERWRLEPYGEIGVQPEPYMPRRMTILLMIGVSLVTLNFMILVLHLPMLH